MKTKNFNFFLINLFFTAVIVFFILILWQGKWVQGFFITALLTLTIFLFTLWHAFQKFGIRNALVFLILVLFVSFGLEFIGTNLANDFNGYYKYSEYLGLQIFGVPLLVILMWVSIIYVSHQVSEHITNFRFTGTTTFVQKFWISAWCALLTSLIVVSWDFALEPLARELGWWEWLVEGEYFGVPLQNFVGWIVISFSAVFIYKLFFEKEKLEEGTTFNYAPVIGYALLCVWTIFMAINLGWPIVALIAFATMFPYISIMIIKFLISQLNLPEQYKK